MNNYLSEYPRPQLVRESYLSLNGVWEYAFSSKNDIPDTFEGKIIVPFSPETTLSGVNKILMPNDFLFYKKILKFENFQIKDEIILHFTAVDQIAEVFINKKFIGKHIGGFLPFSFKIKKYLKFDGKDELIVKVQDTTNTSYHASGKQSLTPAGIFYPAQSGIYLPVWIESVSDDYIEKLTITPDIDKSGVILNVKTSSKKCDLLFNDTVKQIPANKDYFLEVKNPKLWTPENPHLYNFSIKTENDSIKSYFALRKISLIKSDFKFPVIALNNKPYFIKGVLDQGYYKEGLLTPKSDQDYINDIQLIKKLGFNCSRKHIKIESLRWYYHCDRLGLIVWQDFVNSCTKYTFLLNQVPCFVPYKVNDHFYKFFHREILDGRNETFKEFKETIDYLYNVPSICLWTIFNEAWGQFDSKKIFNILKTIDATRLFDHASGWHDQGSGHMLSRHIYQRKIPSPLFLRKRAYVVSECGAFILDENEMNKKKSNLIYSVFNNKEDFAKRYELFIKNDIIPSKKKGMSAFIYTQLSDVEEEKNGFIFYDRSKPKVDIENIKKINDLII